MLTVTLPRRHSGQQQIVNEQHRYNVVCCGRRFGKSALGVDRLATPETLPHPMAWFSPTYKMLLEVWRDAERVFRPITKRRNASERRIELVTGGVIEFWSMDNPDVARGRKYRRVIIDEAAMVANLMDAWQMVLRPTLVDLQGDAYMLSTPKGRNGFWQMFEWGQSASMRDWSSWQMPSGVNPHIPPGEIDAMREMLPERVFAQEVQAQFLDDAGGVFRRVVEAATAEEQQSGTGDYNYVIGVDWGKLNDFTVLTVLDLSSNAVVHLDRFNQIDYAVQVGRLEALAHRFRPKAIIAERNSIGEPLIEQLRRANLPVQPFVTTNSTKAQIIESLSLAFERGDIRIPNDQTLINELQAYEMDRLPSGAMRYSAPEGMHDDCVMSLALAWHGAQLPAASSLVDFI